VELRQPGAGGEEVGAVMDCHDEIFGCARKITRSSPHCGIFPHRCNSMHGEEGGEYPDRTIRTHVASRLCATVSTITEPHMIISSASVTVYTDSGKGDAENAIPCNQCRLGDNFYFLRRRRECAIDFLPT